MEVNECTIKVNECTFKVNECSVNVLVTGALEMKLKRSSLVYILSKNKKNPLFFINIPDIAFQHFHKLTIFKICETSEDNMREKMPPIVLRVIPARSVLVNLTTI